MILKPNGRGRSKLGPSVLVVQGQSVGEVWFDKQADDDGVFPECGDDGKHLSFLDWYERWLNKAPKQIPIAKIWRKSGIPPR